MSDKQKELKSAGFMKLPALDPDYFKLREKLGFLLLLNEKQKLSYHVFTINAYSCLHSAKKAVEGEYADRARDFRDALRDSELDDWVVYFRPNGLYPGLRQLVRDLILDYRSLNTNRARSDPNETVWSYKVTHEETKRTLTIVTNKPLTDEEAVGKFLYKWQKTLDQDNNRKCLGLASYYSGCKQLARASREWMMGAVTSFSIVEIEELSRKKRGAVIRSVAQSNTAHSQAYRQVLTA